MKADSPLVKEVRESPNGRGRAANEDLRFVVVHGTWMDSDADALARLCDPVAEVSCHYYIARDGKVTQLVPESRVAYHAGKSRWEVGGRLYDGLNAWSLGIEVGNAGPFRQAPGVEGEARVRAEDWAAAEPYTEAQYVALEGLLMDILARNPGISPDCVLGHDDVAPGRKTDPGKHFDWQRLVRAGVCVRP